MKKGTWSLEFTGKLILALFFAGFGMVFIHNLSQGTNVGYDKDLCKVSVIANAKARIVGTEIYTNLNCPTRYVTITPKEYIVETKNENEKFKIKCSNLGSEKSRVCFFKKANQVISNLMFDCWDQFAAGKLSVFNKYDQRRQCMICARIEFKDLPADVVNEFKSETYERGTHSLQEYLRSTSPLKHKITYYQFLLDKIDAYAPPLYEYDLQQPMAVVFTALNENAVTHYEEVAWSKLKGLNLEFKGIQFNIFHDKRETDTEYKFVNTIDFVPYDEVATKCDALR